MLDISIKKGNVINYNSAMRAASREGHMDIVKFMINLGANDYESAMVNAAYKGDVDIIKLMLDHYKEEIQTSGKEAKNYGYVMRIAAMGGCKNIIYLILEHLSKDPIKTSVDLIEDYNVVMSTAASNGHLDIVELMLENGATAYDWALNTPNQDIKFLLNIYRGQKTKL